MPPSVTKAGPATGSVEIACARCDAVFRLPAGAYAAAVDASSGRPRCPACGFVPRSLEPVDGARPESAPVTGARVAAPPREGEPVAACWVCGTEELYVQKDFNRTLGLWIVVASFFAIFLVMLLVGHLWGIYLLFALALADWIVYRSLPNVTVCYLCQSIYRGYPLGGNARGFYLGLEEKHKHLRQRWLAEQGLSNAELSVDGPRERSPADAQARADDALEGGRS